MPLNNCTEQIVELCELKDIENLKKLAVPINRTLHKSDSFRSALMLSTFNVKHLTKIPNLSAECIILNLEDGVSVEQKPYALVLCALALASNPVCNKKLVVRINALEEGGVEEILYLNPFMPDAIRIPKIRTIEDVRTALNLVDQNIDIHLSVETKEAWLALNDLNIDSRIKVFYLGFLDLFAELGLSQSLLIPDNPTIQYMLSHFLVTCRALMIKPVSFVYQDYKNYDGLRNWLELEKMIGFDAKGCITPTQADMIHEIFGHSEEEISRSNEIIRLFECHAKEGITGFIDEKYGFIDEPIYKGALAVLKNR